MKNKKNSQSDNTWYGFGLGLLGGAALVWAFGTQKGRETIRHLADSAENLEGEVGGILKEYGLEAEEYIKDTIKPVEHVFENVAQSSSPLKALIDRIGINSKHTKKLFLKEDQEIK